MEPLAFLRSKIDDFPGYADEADRGRSDELVRSYLGEVLADLDVRLAMPSPDLRERLGDLLIRAGFVNQIAFKQYENAARDGVAFAAVASDDAAIVALADRGRNVDFASVSAYLDEVAAALDRRDAAMESVRS